MPPSDGFMVALVGADGAGKSTVAARLVATLPLPASSVYLGDDPPKGVPVLITTRLLRRHWAQDEASGPATAQRPTVRPPAPPDGSAHQRSTPAQIREGIRQLVVTGLQMAEEHHQYRRALRQVRRGRVTVLDRHYYYDYYYHHVAQVAGSPAHRLHGWWLTRVLPKPDITFCLDAPAELLYARKPEGTLQERKTRRDEYVRMENDVRLRMVDVSRPVDEIVRELSEAVQDFAAQRRQA